MNEISTVSSQTDHWYADALVCPVDKSALSLKDNYLVSATGRRYPVVDGIPILTIEEVEQTLHVARASMDCAEGVTRLRGTERYANLHLDSLGITPAEIEELIRILDKGDSKLDPVVLMMIGATSGYSYASLVGDRNLAEYPIPDIPLPPGEGRTLLDIGCNWGRWCVAAARKGYRPTGLDPSLGAVLAARRVCQELGLEGRFVVGDGRYLPFPGDSFDTVYSYSVIQHFAKENGELAISEAGRVLKKGGTAKVQMAAKYGIRSLQHQLRRGFREPKMFEVRYYGVGELKRMFEQRIGRTRVSADCYFGLGWRWSDYRFLQPSRRLILILSEALRRISNVFTPMRAVADSVFLTATKR